MKIQKKSKVKQNLIKFCFLMPQERWRKHQQQQNQQQRQKKQQVKLMIHKKYKINKIKNNQDNKCNIFKSR